MTRSAVRRLRGDGVVFVEPEGSDYWAEWHDYVVRHLKEPGLISPHDTDLYLVTESVDQAIEEELQAFVIRRVEEGGAPIT